MIFSNLALTLVVLCLSRAIENGGLSSLIVTSNSSKSTNSFLVPEAPQGESCPSVEVGVCVVESTSTCNPLTSKYQCFNSTNSPPVKAGYSLNMVWDASLNRCNSNSSSLRSRLPVLVTDEQKYTQDEVNHFKGYSCKEFDVPEAAQYRIGTCWSGVGAQSSGWLKFMIPVVAVAAIFQR